MSRESTRVENNKKECRCFPFFAYLYKFLITTFVFFIIENELHLLIKKIIIVNILEILCGYLLN